MGSKDIDDRGTSLSGQILPQARGLSTLDKNFFRPTRVRSVSYEIGYPSLQGSGGKI
jgi:hypothetical protein